jgi:hypothetical protein
VLLRKLLGGDAHAASSDEPYPELRVDGRRMPIQLYPDDPTPPPLALIDILSVESWIDQGAPF